MKRPEAAQQMLQVHAYYAERGISLATAALAGASEFVRWQHYPKNDATDAVNHTRFFYHAHDQDDTSVHEHGHFHVFAKTRNATTQEYAHVVGISLNAMGEPTRLFTTNQWVTGEAMLTAHLLEQQLHHFALKVHGRLAPLAKWLTAMLMFYQETVVNLLHQRDVKLARHRLGFEAALDDRKIHIVSQKKLTRHWDHLKKEIV